MAPGTNLLPFPHSPREEFHTDHHRVHQPHPSGHLPPSHQGDCGWTPGAQTSLRKASASCMKAGTWPPVTLPAPPGLGEEAGALPLGHGRGVMGNAAVSPGAVPQAGAQVPVPSLQSEMGSSPQGGALSLFSASW
uniref:RUNX family transcription factor 3 n=1 Tax=Molossus molossus TaxID=27622 RepID=A0A7J8FBS8_MOLMO|nr:RUNX family transcription factor 3 [Molossus molossus]